MSSRLDEQADTSLSELVHRLADDGRAWATAEVTFYREVALYRVGKAKVGAIAIGIGAVLGLAAPIILLVMVAIGLAGQIGPIGAGLVVAGVTALAALLLIRFGAGKLRALGGDAEERGERRA